MTFPVRPLDRNTLAAVLSTMFNAISRVTWRHVP